ncbi:MAG TPA: glutamine synthetase adenylyltransferase, partial [Planctomycetaceae bacterium]|nr:glutamine synthetase adenylyltransferase [Planctomycetaceae bacterium]
ATHGRHPLDAAAFFQRFVERFTHSIRARREGIFHIDLRLRPYGRAGQLAVTLAAFEQYFCMDGPAWPYERQSLVKLRPLAGDPRFGAQLAVVRDRILYTGDAFDFAAVRAIREQQLRKLVQPGTFHAKLSPGGLVDVEYLVQALQITHGHHSVELRNPNTRAAARALNAAGVLPQDDLQRLLDAYIFLRRLIDALRMVRGDARDLTVPPVRSEEFEFLARRLNYGADVFRLWEDLEQHSQAVLELVRRHAPSASDAPSTISREEP